MFGHPCFNTLKPTSYLRTTRFNIQITTFCPHSTLYVLCGSQNKRHYFLYSVNWFVFITETECLSSVIGRVMAQAVSRRSLTAEVRVQSQVMWTKYFCDRFLSEYFGLPRSISFHQRSIFLFIYLLSLPERQTVEAQEPSKKQSSFGNQEE